LQYCTEAFAAEQHKLGATAHKRWYRMRFYNSDGSPGEMCGNGLRGFVKYCHDRQLMDGCSHVTHADGHTYPQWTVETGAGARSVTVTGRDSSGKYARQLSADMGVPELSPPEQLPV